MLITYYKLLKLVTFPVCWEAYTACTGSGRIVQWLGGNHFKSKLTRSQQSSLKSLHHTTFGYNMYSLSCLEVSMASTFSTAHRFSYSCMKIGLLTVSMSSMSMRTRWDTIFRMEFIQNGQYLLKLSHFPNGRRKNSLQNVKS